MADPISILAIAALVYTGRKLSKSDEEKYSIDGKSIEDESRIISESDRDITIDSSYLGPLSPLVEPTYQNKQEVSSFADISQQNRSSGGEVLDMRGRMMYDGV
jgi:hypothetical protein